MILSTEDWVTPWKMSFNMLVSTLRTHQILRFPLKSQFVLAVLWASFLIGIFLLTNDVLHICLSWFTQTWIPIESYHCHKYIITFVEDFTSIAWTIPLHSKDAALVLTRHFLKMVSTQFNAKVQEWMSDAGGEYKSRAFDDLLKGEGICIFQSAPHTP